MLGGRRGRDRKVVGFTTTYMQLVPITTDVVISNPASGELYNIMWWRLSMAYGRSVVFSVYSWFLHQ